MKQKIYRWIIPITCALLLPLFFIAAFTFVLEDIINITPLATPVQYISGIIVMITSMFIYEVQSRKGVQSGNNIMTISLILAGSYLLMSLWRQDTCSHPLEPGYGNIFPTAAMAAMWSYCRKLYRFFYNRARLLRRTAEDYGKKAEVCKAEYSDLPAMQKYILFASTLLFIPYIIAGIFPYYLRPETKGAFIIYFILILRFYILLHSYNQEYHWLEKGLQLNEKLTAARSLSGGLLIALGILLSL